MSETEERVVKELNKFDLRCDLFSDKEMKEAKTPDRRVYRGSEFAFFCEVKEIAEDPWLEGIRQDPILNRITYDIHTAVKQFDSVNPYLEHPNVLAFVNNDDKCGSLDLVSAITGHLLLENGGAAPIYIKYSEGRIKDEKHRIHLYLWFDSFKADKFLFNTVDKRHLDKLCTYFGINPKDIEVIKLK
jgi:hypothetical protein